MVDDGALAIIASVVIHGSSVTPAMNWLERHRTDHRLALGAPEDKGADDHAVRERRGVPVAREVVAP